MTNSFYNASGTPAPSSRGKSLPIRVEYSGIAAGFDLVEAQLNLKAPKASPTFTGTVDMSGATSVLVPTATLGDTSSKAASMSALAAAIGASGTLVPSAVGQDGKVLTASGGTYGWQAKFPTETGKRGQALLTDGSSEYWGPSLPISGGGYASYSVSATHTTAERLLDMSSAAAGSVVTLDDARNLIKGETFWWTGSGTSQSGIASADGEIIASDSSGSGGILVLTDNTTLAGTWKQISSANAIQSLPATREIAGQLTTLRSTKDSIAVGQIDTSNYLVVCGSSASGAIDAFVATVTGTSVAAGSVVNIGSSVMGWSKLLAVTGGWVFLFHDGSNTLKGVGITVSGTTVTVGSITTLISSTVAAGINVTEAASTGATAVAVTNKTTNTIAAIAIQLSGTTLVVGAESTLASSATLTARCRIVANSATSFMWGALAYDGTNYTLRCGHLSLSAVTITPGTVTTSGTITVATPFPFSMEKVSGTSVVMSYGQAGGSILTLVVSAITTTPVFNAALTVTPSGTTSNYVHVTSAGSYFAVMSANGSSAWLYQLSISGTTVTAVGSPITSIGSATANAGTLSPITAWDGTYLIVTENASRRIALYSLGAGGPTLSMASVVTTDGYDNFSHNKRLAWRLGGKSYVVFQAYNGGHAQARVQRYGGIA